MYHPYQHPNSALNGDGANMTMAAALNGRGVNIDGANMTMAAALNGRGVNMAAAVEWSWADNKIFEDALVKFPEEFPNRFQRIAGYLPGKSPHDAMQHYETLMLDVADIEAGRVQLPNYSEARRRTSSPPLSSGDRKSQCERKKGKPWTIEEHRLFLLGLKMYGKSDWRSISRNVVTTRLPSQVASHAQKFFNRLKSAKKERKRSSIHDITSESFTDIELPYFNNTAAAAVESPYVPTEQPIKVDCFETDAPVPALPAPLPYTHQSFRPSDHFQM